MFTNLRLGCLSLLLVLNSTVRAEDAPAPEVPPTPEEVQAALEAVSKWFTWNSTSRPSAAPVKQPEWYPLKPGDAARVEEVLTPWRQSRAKGGRLRCRFQKWEFDPVFGPKDGTTPYV